MWLSYWIFISHHVIYTLLCNCEQRANLKSAGCRSFSNMAPKLLNSLPNDLKETTSLTTFKSKLNKFYFTNFIMILWWTDLVKHRWASLYQNLGYRTINNNNNNIISCSHYRIHNRSNELFVWATILCFSGDTMATSYEETTTRTSYYTETRVESTSGPCGRVIDQQYIRGIPGLLKLLEAVSYHANISYNLFKVQLSPVFITVCKCECQN